MNNLRKAPAWNPVWSNYEGVEEMGKGKGSLGIGEGEVGISPLAGASFIYIILDIFSSSFASGILSPGLCLGCDISRLEGGWS